MKALIASFALVLLVSCTAKTQRQEAKAASAESVAEVSRPTLTQQKMCTEQARKAFDEDEQHARQLFGGRDQPISYYTSHFDPQKNVCYVRITSTSTNIGVSETLC